MRIARGLAIATAVAATALAGVLPVSAAVLDREEETGQGTERIEDFCGSGVTYTNEFAFMIWSTVKTRGAATLYFADKSTFSQTFTNLVTNKTMSVTGHGTFRDQRITINDDGTLTIVQQSVGQQIVRDTNNKIVAKETGVTRYRLVVDYNGTLGNPDDDIVVEDFGVVLRAGQQDIVGTDFCEVALRLTA